MRRYCAIIGVSCASLAISCQTLGRNRFEVKEFDVAGHGILCYTICVRRLRSMSKKNLLGRAAMLGFPGILFSASLFSNLFAAGTVTSCDEPSLRQAMTGGGLVTLACDGTIALT